MKSSLFLICIALFGCIFSLSFAAKATGVAGGYTRLTSAQVRADKSALGALNYGAKIIAADAIKNHRVPYFKYQATDIYEAKVQVVAGRNYVFNADISNARGSTIINADYQVFQNLNGKYSLVSQTYQVVQKDAC